MSREIRARSFATACISLILSTFERHFRLYRDEITSTAITTKNIPTRTRNHIVS
jgi:hypothetical protein